MEVYCRGPCPNRITNHFVGAPGGSDKMMVFVKMCGKSTSPFFLSPMVLIRFLLSLSKLEPVYPLLLVVVVPPKQGPTSNQNKGHLRVAI